MTDLARLSAAVADRFVIERMLGAGGMATVYLARDLKHDRDVALKVLRPELGQVLGTERFLSEIRITAKLDHPHILTLIDSGESDGFLYYVLPYVRGESLRDLMTRETQLNVEQAVAIARQVASALDFAHRHGVVHRDLKPENILLQEGEAMLADFGIALAVQEAGGARLTETGLSLGTPQYMSPEQATGDRSVGARSDIYSLGAVLYEMLAGEVPISGATMQAMVARLITESPTPLSVMRPSVPSGVDAAVAKALAKAPADRFATAAEFSDALARALHAEPAAPSPSTRQGRRTIAIGVGLAAIAGAAFLLTRGPAPVGFEFGRAVVVTADPDLEVHPDLSPDGNLVAYASGPPTELRIVVRPVSGGRAVRITDAARAIEALPRWSPDGDRLLFISDGNAALAPALGGTPRILFAKRGGRAGRGVTAVAWSDDGSTALVASDDSLFLVPVDGGAIRTLATLEDPHSCDWSSDGKWIACASGNSEATLSTRNFGNIAPSALALIRVSDGAVRLRGDPRHELLSPHFTPDAKHLVFVSNEAGTRDAYALPIQAAWRGRGEPQRLTTGLNAFSITIARRADRLAYAVFTARANVWSVPIGAREATVATATERTTGSQVVEAVFVSADERWLYFDSNMRGNADIFRVPIDGGVPEQLTSDPWDEFAPSVSADGRTLAYHSWRTGSRDVEVRTIGTGEVQRVTDTPRQESYPSISPDGNTIAIYDQSDLSGWLSRRTASGWSAPVQIATRTRRPTWSPDGRILAVGGDSGILLVSPEDGSTIREIRVRWLAAFLHEQVRFSRSGDLLYYKGGEGDRGYSTIWSVPVRGGTPTVAVRFPDPRFQSLRSDFDVGSRAFYFPVEERRSDLFVVNLVRR